MKLALALLILIIAQNGKSQDAPQIVALSNGDLYTFGVYAGQLIFNNGDTVGEATSTSRGYFLARMDSRGKTKWTRDIRGTVFFCAGICSGVGLCTDRWDNAYITGTYIDTIKFDSTTILSYSNSSKAFIAKYDSNGTFKWVREALGNGYSSGVDIDSDSAGNVYATGSYNIQSLSFDTLSPIPDSSYIDDVYIVKLDSGGNGVWISQLQGGGTGSGSNHSVHSLETDKYGNTYITGNFGGFFKDTLFFGSHFVVAHGQDFEIYFAKCNNSGKPLWLKKVDGYPGFDLARQITVFDTNYIYLAGFYRENATFGTLPTLYADPGDYFIASYDYLGNTRWVKHGQPFAELNSAGAIGTVVDSNTDIVTIGGFSGTVEFNTPAPQPTIHISSDSGHSFLVKHNMVGEALCVTNNYLNYQDITVDFSGSVYTISGDPGEYGSDQLIISKWDNDCNHLWDSIITHDFFVGVERPDQELSLTAVPNPTANFLTVDIINSDLGLAYLQLYNTSGQLLLKQSIGHSTQNVQLDIGEFARGIYILQLVSNKGSVTKKIVKI